MKRIFLLCLVTMVFDCAAAIYPVGPSRPHTNLQALFDAVNLEPGDVVEVDGDVPIYNVGTTGIIMRGGSAGNDNGAPGNPIIIRGVGNARPILQGGFNTIEFRSSNHVVFENFEVTGVGDTLSGTFRCIYHHAHDITIRRVLVRDCPRHGILGADTDSGSLTVEFSEVRNAGSNGGQHAIYMSTDQIVYPGSVFRLQYSKLSDSRFDDTRDGGNLIKSRAERNEIYYNWLENAYFHELELIGPDPGGIPYPEWNEALKREDSDVVGNVILHTGSFGSVLRFGGDATGQSFGRYRFVNNTVIRRNANNDTPTIFRLFDGIESLEFHNNVILREGNSSLTLARAVEAEWAAGVKIRGSNNWIDTGFVTNPSNLSITLSNTISGTDPGFINAATNNFRPAVGSPLLQAGTSQTVTSPDYNFANPLFPPQYHPPTGDPALLLAAEARPVDANFDIGAFELPDSSVIFTNGFE